MWGGQYLGAVLARSACCWLFCIAQSRFDMSQHYTSLDVSGKIVLITGDREFGNAF